MKRYVAVCLLTAGGLWAQMPGMFPWWDSPIAGDLKLSEDQHRRIRETVREVRGKINQLRAATETAEAELADFMNDDRVDAQKTAAAIDKVIAARGEMSREVSLMSLKLRQILTTEQWRELQRRQPRPPGPGPQQGQRPGPPGERPPNRPGPPPRPRPDL